jgi:hypothetical protein
MKEIDIKGKKFNRLTAIRRDESHTGANLKWFFSCECGVVKSISKASVVGGHVVSCGCYNREKCSFKKHGLSRHPLYRTWNGMIQRCTHLHNKDYPRYGGRGITVCDRWMDVRNFIADMGNRPNNSTLDRIDNNKGYSPSNCKWSKPIEQGNNKSNNRTLKLDNTVYSSLAEAARKFNIPESTLRNRLKTMSFEEAISIPISSKNKKHHVGNGRYLTLSEIASIVGCHTPTIRNRIKQGYTGEKLLRPVMSDVKIA